MDSRRPRHSKPNLADMAAQERASTLIGTVISGRYRIIDLLAMGGVGAVYLAEHVLMHKHVALKVLHPDTQGLPDLVPRFEREAVAGAHIQHPNVAAATDFGQLDDGSHFLVLEYVRGTTLREVIKRGPLPAGRVVNIGRQMAAGLGAAHAMGIVHRDIKPRNVMLAEGERDVVKIIDFGLAKLELKQVSEVAANRGASFADERITTSGAVFGTIAYLAPEAAMGMDTVDGRADLYALGLTMYELLSGQHPFDVSDPVELFRQHHKVPPPPIAERTPGVTVPPALEALVMRLLAKSPEERFQSTEELILALDAPEMSSPTTPSTAPPVQVSETSAIFPGPSLARTSLAPPESLAAPPLPAPGAESVAPAPSPSASPPTMPTPAPPAPAPLAAEPSATAPAATVAPPSALRRWQYILVAAGIVVIVIAEAAIRLSGNRGASDSTGDPQSASASPVSPTPSAPSAMAAPIPAPPSTVPTPATSPSSAPAAHFDAVASRTMLRRAAAARDWVRANEAFLALAQGDPASFHDPSLMVPARDVAARAGLAGGEEADRIYDLLAQRLGSDGPDILYDVVRTRGSSKSSARALSLLQKEEVISRASPALRITLAFRDAPCTEKPALLDRAVAEGDGRTLLVMQTVGAACLGKSSALQDAEKALRIRLRGR